MNSFYPSFLFILAILLFGSLAMQAQERAPLQNQKARSAMSQQPTVVSPFEKIAHRSSFDDIVDEATYLRLDAGKLKTALETSPRELIFEIPRADGGTVQLLLHRQQILTDDFKVVDQKGKELPFETGQFFTGRVLDREQHTDPANAAHREAAMASLSITGGEVMGIMTIEHENFVLGAVADNTDRKSAEYVLYNDKNLEVANGFSCGSDELEHVHNPGTDASNHMPMAGSKVVKVQFEADNRMYQDFGSSSAAVTNYVTGLFNMVATIYQNENIVTQISNIVVWTVADPYGIVAGSTSGDVLNNLRARKNLVGMTGDLTHLLSTAPRGHGGIAWVDVLCHPEDGLRTAYSNISTTYNNFPLYSWTVDVVTHEMGHNLGSWHTHTCVWGAGGNQALDNCFATEGGCAPGPAPVNGGTIMSYCHLTAAGKNFNLGFGSQPGNLIRSKVNAASCLGTADLVCAGATPIFCGEAVNGTTVGATNNVSVYGCNSWVQSGPEKVFVLNTTEPGTITASLSNLSADLDVIILDACSEGTCLAEGNTTAVVADAPAGEYFIVVDGYNGAQGTFRLNVNCEGPCFAAGSTNFEFIERVEVGTIDNASGNDYGYADFTSQSTPLHRGGTAPLTLTPGFNGSAYNERWRIWIDLNKDDDFNDYGELVYNSAASNSAVSGTMNIPAWAQLGETRMRVVMRFGAAPNDCGELYGEVEDYTVDIQEYCPSLGDTKYEFIDAVSIDDFTMVSGDDGGYADFTGATSIDLLKSDSIPVTLVPGFQGSAYGEKWAVMIDLNQNSQFEASEVLFSTSVGSTDTVNGHFVIPASAPVGETRLRVVMNYGTSPGACSYNFYGETEDYLVNISPFCPSAANSNFEFIQTVGIGDLLNESGDDGGYADFTDLPAEAFAGEATGIVLIPGFASGEYKEYWRVWVDLDGNKRFDASEKVFEAGPSMDLIFGALNIPAEVAGGDYGLRVAMRYGTFPQPCGGNGYGEVEDYILTIIGDDDFGGGGSIDRSSDGTPAIHFGEAKNGGLSLYPNPAKNTVNLKWENTQAIGGQVVSASGQTMFTFGAANVPSQINVTDYPTGLYMLQVLTADQKVVTERFVKMD